MAAEGGTVSLDRVLLIAEGDNITSGTPVIEGARVTATVKGDGKSDKVIVYKFKSKTRYRRKKGHRQPFTTLTIDKILAPGMAEAKPARKTTRRKKAAEPKEAKEQPENKATDLAKEPEKTEETTDGA